MGGCEPGRLNWTSQLSRIWTVLTMGYEATYVVTRLRSFMTMYRLKTIQPQRNQRI